MAPDDLNREISRETSISPRQLGDAITGALARAKVEAEQQGDETLRKLLDLSRVKSGRGALQTEVTIPLAPLRDVLCGEGPQAK